MLSFNFLYFLIIFFNTSGTGQRHPHIRGFGKVYSEGQWVEGQHAITGCRAGSPKSGHSPYNIFQHLSSFSSQNIRQQRRHLHKLIRKIFCTALNRAHRENDEGKHMVAENRLKVGCSYLQTPCTNLIQSPFPSLALFLLFLNASASHINYFPRPKRRSVGF